MRVAEADFKTSISKVLLRIYIMVIIKQQNYLEAANEIETY